HDCQKEYWGVEKGELGDDSWFPPCGVATSPLMDGDTVIVAVGGKKAGAFAGFDRTTGKQVWKALDDRSSYASPVIRSPGRGEPAWTSPSVNGKYFSLVLAGDAVLVLNSEGELRAFKADPGECTELAKWRVSGKGVWAHLAVAGNRLYVKDKDTLYCYELN